MRDDVKRSWRIRRRVIIATLVYSALGVGYLIIFGEDLRLHEAIANGLILLAGSVVGSYVFGAAWDDMNADKDSRSRGYEE
ncbi:MULTISPECIES: hypothetical protein [unclassified Yoonia]|uniref:hypothetical protein n=1 Tax=unclassified Yoonia TaxID=2629118 RepID=UPI002AFDE1D6|nr:MULTISPECIES: hypothetical protein [unclassified Yoonia]